MINPLKKTDFQIKNSSKIFLMLKNKVKEKGVAKMIMEYVKYNDERHDIAMKNLYRNKPCGLFNYFKYHILKNFGELNELKFVVCSRIIIHESCGCHTCFSVSSKCSNPRLKFDSFSSYYMGQFSEDHDNIKICDINELTKLIETKHYITNSYQSQLENGFVFNIIGGGNDNDHLIIVFNKEEKLEKDSRCDYALWFYKNSEFLKRYLKSIEPKSEKSHIRLSRH
jgi:hypothetical protein